MGIGIDESLKESKFVDQRTGLKFNTAIALAEFQRDYPAPAFVQVGDQPWMNRDGSDKPLTNAERLAQIEVTKLRYTPAEIAYLSSTDSIAEYIANPIVFLAKWTR
jgi:hypothetical protein